MAMIRKRYRFYGRVQGVGFRFTAKYFAQSLDLTGWVRNEWDGTVTMEVQGSQARIEKLLERLHAERYIRIDWIDSEDLECVPQERRFLSK